MKNGIQFDRRQVLKFAAALAAGFGVHGLPEPVLAALKQVSLDDIPKIVYLQGLSCTGCSISLLQSPEPSPLSLITDYSKLAFHADLSATSGAQALELIDAYISGEAGDYFLAVEGAIPYAMPEACVIGNKTFAQYLEEGARTMSGAIAVGTCASFGGIPAAEDNLTGAISVSDFYKKKGIDPLLINIPGCPVHPDWLWHTITHMIKVGMPELTSNLAPKMFFGKTLHESCPRYHDFQEQIFARKLGEKGCLFKLGCLGPETKADCPTRWWNGGKSWCIDANAPCIGCASPGFARVKNFPFYRIG